MQDCSPRDPVGDSRGGAGGEFVGVPVRLSGRTGLEVLGGQGLNSGIQAPYHVLVVN